MLGITLVYVDLRKEKKGKWEMIFEGFSSKNSLQVLSAMKVFMSHVKKKSHAYLAPSGYLITNVSSLAIAQFHLLAA